MEQKKTFYHVTSRDNLESIMKHGLNPNYLNPKKATPEVAIRKFKEKGVDYSSLDLNNPPQPAYRKSGFRGIWLGDIEIVNKYASSPTLEKENLIFFKVEIPEEWLKDHQVPCPALYGCEDFDSWLKYTEENFKDPILRVIEGLGVRHVSRDDMYPRYLRRTRMTTVDAAIPPEWLTILEV